MDLTTFSMNLLNNNILLMNSYLQRDFIDLFERVEIKNLFNYKVKLFLKSQLKSDEYCS